MTQKLYCCVTNVDGWWYGQVYTVKDDGTEDKVLWKSSAWKKKADAASEAFSRRITMLQKQQQPKGT